MTFEEWHKDTHKDKLMNLCCIGYALEAWNVSAEAHKPRWIPVSERLPDKDGYYPCVAKYWDCWVSRVFDKNKNKFISDESNLVTHWIELPELPE